MKKLALTLATLGLLAAPVLACPNMEEGKAEETAPRTAEKDKAKPAEKAKEQPKTTAKPAEKSKDQPKTATDSGAKAKEQPKTEKKPDKVSAR